MNNIIKTRSQAVARRADRTASQHHGGHVTPSDRSRDHLILHMSFPFGGPMERRASLSSRFRQHAL